MDKESKNKEKELRDQGNKFEEKDSRIQQTSAEVENVKRKPKTRRIR